MVINIVSATEKSNYKFFEKFGLVYIQDEECMRLIKC